MPNRIIKESICRSDEIDSLSWFEEVLFYRLIVNCDDYGRFDGRSAIIKGSLFPLKDVAIKDIEKSLKRLVAVGLVGAYEAQGKPVLQLLTWEKHQNIRAKKSRYPAFDNTCIQMYSSDCECSRNPIQSESKSESESESESNVCTEPETASVPTEPPVMTLLLNTGEEYPVTQKDVDEWSELYPAVDVMQELRAMKGWCKENKTKRKTKRGIGRFINSWLARTQNSGGTPGYTQTAPVANGSRVGKFADMARGWADE